MRKERISTTNNNRMEEKGMKSGFIHFKKRFVPALSGALMGVMLMSTTCFAAGDTSAVTQPLENLKTHIIAVIGAVGVIILAKNVMEFAQAYQQQDSSTMNSALKGIVAGVMMAGISIVLTFLRNNANDTADRIEACAKKSGMEVVETIFNTDKKAVERLRYYIERDIVEERLINGASRQEIDEWVKTL